MKRTAYDPFVTARTRNALSSPMKRLLKNKMLYGKILDFGTGHGSDVKLLKQLNFDIQGYDRYNAKFNKPELLNKHYDVVTCHYVFNVIATWEQFDETLARVACLSDNVYISVRTDKKAIQPDWLYDDDLKGYWTSKSFQRFYTIDDIYAQFGKEVEIIRSSSSYILFKL